MIRIAYTHGIGFDLVNANGLQTDKDLETACIISLFTDARATDEELRLAGLPLNDHRGFWGDQFLELPSDSLGSKLWLLARSQRTDETLRQYEDYSYQALTWMLRTQVAQRVTTAATWYQSTGLLVLEIEIHRPRAVQPRWRRVWDAVTGEILEAA